MPTTYDNDAFDDARTAVLTELDELLTYMAANAIVPKFDAVYDTHWETPALDFNCVSVGITDVSDLTLSPNRVEYLYTIELRIYTGEENTVHAEVTFLRLANSVLNWFRAHASTLTGSFRLKDSIPARVESNIFFEDTGAKGGRVTFTIFGVEVYTQV